MTFDELETALSRHSARIDLAGRLAAFRAAHPDSDADRLLAQLHRDGAISTRVFTEVLSGRSLDVHGTRSDGVSSGARFPTPADPPPSPEVIGEVGRGAMGVVQVVKDPVLRRIIAFKVMDPDHAKDGGRVARFFQEAQVTAQLDHPNIVPVYALARGDRDVPAYAMKLIHGRTLEALIDETRQRGERGEPLDRHHSVETRLEHFLKVCDAIAYAHNRGVLHRDLKPANVMIGAFNEVYVMDWGIAKVIGGPPDDPESLAQGDGDVFVHATQMGTAIGTPSFMSPEQARGENEALDARSDLFSLGLVLYELLALHPAYEGHPLAVLVRSQEGRIQELHDVPGREPISPDLLAIVAKATRPAREDRYPSVSAFAEDIRRHLRGEAPSARPDTSFRRLSRWLGRHRDAALILLLLAIVVAAAAVIGGQVALASSREAAREREEALAGLLTSVATSANSADSSLVELRAILEGLADGAAAALTTEQPPPAPVFYSDDLDTAGLRPPDLAESPRYRRPVSVGWATFELAPGVSPEHVAGTVARLAPLRTHFRRMFLRASNPADLALGTRDAFRRVAVDGVPLTWAFVGTEDGVHTSYPGHGGYADDYDPRQRPWYALGAQSPGPRWGAPYHDVNGQGLLLPCVASVVDDDGTLLGVAGLELPVDVAVGSYVAEALRNGATHGVLLDADGRVLLRTDGDPTAEPTVYEIPAVVAAATTGRAGWVAHGASLSVYAPLPVLGWTLVWTGDTRAMLTSQVTNDHDVD